MTDTTERRSALRLVWSRPEPVSRRAPQRMNLAHAIERHLRGDGLTDEQFARLYATAGLVDVSARR